MTRKKNAPKHSEQHGLHNDLVTLVNTRKNGNAAGLLGKLKNIVSQYSTMCALSTCGPVSKFLVSCLSFFWALGAVQARFFLGSYHFFFEFYDSICDGISARRRKTNARPPTSTTRRRAVSGLHSTCHRAHDSCKNSQQLWHPT